jgi:hypothetical protein
MVEGQKPTTSAVKTAVTLPLLLLLLLRLQL